MDAEDLPLVLIDPVHSFPSRMVQSVVFARMQEAIDDWDRAFIQCRIHYECLQVDLLASMKTETRWAMWIDILEAHLGNWTVMKSKEYSQ